MHRPFSPGWPQFVKAAAPTPTTASVDVGVVRQRFNWDWAMDPDSFDGADTWPWWAISIRVDPAEVIADDGEGNLWLVPFSTDGEDDVTFGEPVRVRETFVPVSAATPGQAANHVASRRGQRVLAAALERPNKTSPNQQAATEAGREPEEHHMDPAVLAALARQHGFEDPDSATEEQVNAAILAAANPTEPDEPETPEVPVAPAVEPEPVAASADPVSAARIEALENQVREANERLERRDQADAQAEVSARVADVGNAIQDGRIRAADHDTWVTRVSDTTHGAAHAATLAALPRTIPVNERAAATRASTAENSSLGRVLASVPGLNRTKEKVG